MKKPGRKLLALLASFVAGLVCGAAALAVFSFALPIREFGSGIGTFWIWLEMLTPFYGGTFAAVVGPFLFWQSCRPSPMQRKKQVLVASLLFVAVEVATIVLWRAYDYWFLEIFFAVCASVAACAAVLAKDYFWPLNEERD